MASLEDRITRPDAGGKESPAPTEAVPGAQEQIASSSWADEAIEEADTAANASSAPAVLKAQAEKEMSSLASAQTDGATAAQQGEMGVEEPSYNVNIKLADLQADPNDPLYSVKSFEQLGL